MFSPDDPGRFESIAHALRHLDHYMVSADFDAYYEAQRGIDARWQVVPAWTRASILNVARMAWFSSDRTIREYAEDIWRVPVRPTPVLQEAGVAAWNDALASTSRPWQSLTLGVIECVRLVEILSTVRI